MSYPGTFLHACKDTWQPPRHGPPQSLWERGSQSLTLPSLGEELHVGDSLYLRFSRNNMSEASGRLRGLRDTMPEGLSWEIREKLRQKRKGSQSSPRLKDCSFSCGRHAFSPPPPAPKSDLPTQSQAAATPAGAEDTCAHQEEVRGRERPTVLLQEVSSEGGTSRVGKKYSYSCSFWGEPFAFSCCHISSSLISSL